MEINKEIAEPIIPDFIQLKSKVGKKEDGIDVSGQNRILVRDLTEDQAKEYAELWSKTFMELWKSKQ